MGITPDRQDNATSNPRTDEKEFKVREGSKLQETLAEQANDASGNAPDKDPAADAKSPLEDWNWRDQSQGPSHPLDDQGHKKR